MAAVVSAAVVVVVVVGVVVVVVVAVGVVVVVVAAAVVVVVVGVVAAVGKVTQVTGAPAAPRISHTSWAHGTPLSTLLAATSRCYLEHLLSLLMELEIPCFGTGQGTEGWNQNCGCSNVSTPPA